MYVHRQLQLRRRHPRRARAGRNDDWHRARGRRLCNVPAAGLLCGRDAGRCADAALADAACQRSLARRRSRRAGAPQGRATYLTINTQYVKSVKVLAAAPDTGEASGTVPLPFDPSAVKLAATQRTAHQLGQMSTKTFANMNANATVLAQARAHLCAACFSGLASPPLASALEARACPCAGGLRRHPQDDAVRVAGGHPALHLRPRRGDHQAPVQTGGTTPPPPGHHPPRAACRPLRSRQPSASSLPPSPRLAPPRPIAPNRALHPRRCARGRIRRRSLA